jgi:hypothetical protein
MIPSIEILGTGELGPFTFHWWAGNDEAFDRGWIVLASVDGRFAYVRHGVGRRRAYGRDRVHSVTWLDLQPIVEGVEADDNGVSSALLSGIRLTKQFLRPGDPIPAEYGGFNVVVQSEELRVPRSRRILAVKLRETISRVGPVTHSCVPSRGSACLSRACGDSSGPRHARAYP